MPDKDNGQLPAQDSGLEKSSQAAPTAEPKASEGATSDKQAPESPDILPVETLRRAPARPTKPADLIKRRAKVRRWWQGDGKAPDNVVGLALSGGGIRSATFSLGLLQALAKSKRDALSKVDVLSTVSGGGYAGCFFRSLFIPDRGRGITPAAATAASLTTTEIIEQHDFARAILASGTRARNLKWNLSGGGVVTRRNPLWWLREHSRFLAPNGATDYGYALAYIARNWVAMLYIFLVASLAIFAGVAVIEGAYREVRSTDLNYSPLFFAVLPPLSFSVILAVAYWITHAMSPNEPVLRRQWKNLFLASCGTIFGCLFIIGVTTLVNGRAPAFSRIGETPTRGDLVSWLVATGLAVLLFAMAITLILAMRLSAKHSSTLTIELRRTLTNWLANSNQWLIVIAVAGVVDTIGGWLSDWVPGTDWQVGAFTTGSLLPAVAYVIKKLPEWFGRSGGPSPLGLVSRFISAISLAVGLILFGVVAVVAAALIHGLAWAENAWASATNWPQLFLVSLILGCLAVLAGRANGFINMWSVHFFYASRLTRAYLGATNNQRLETAAVPGPSGNIKESDPNDYIQPELYCSTDLPAPLHIINATINETLDPESQLVARDRKGNLLTLEPGGVRVGKDCLSWTSVGETDCAEQLSLGQWCAISGAAVSAAMGRLTNLGFALALTFANVRLGYWWWSPGVCKGAAIGADPFMKRFAGIFGTFVYLSNEITARYSRSYARKYLTDGGHFENTGAYRLIEQKVPLVIVSDNGADPGFRFADLENLTRKVRIDIGGDLEPLGGADLTAFLNNLGLVDQSIFVDPDGDGDWRDQFITGDSRRFVLVLRATVDNSTTHVIWIKPRSLKNLPPDVLVYSSSNPPFPQQSTGDQFFDEAQWESYRALGEFSMRKLLSSCRTLLS